MKKTISQIISWSIAILLMSSMMSSCEKIKTEEPKTEKKVRVTGITLSRTECDVLEGRHAYIVAKVLPENADEKEVFWESSDYDIVTIDQTGKLYGKKEGFAIVTAITKDGDFEASCNVGVRKGKVVEPTSIYVNTKTLNMTLGDIRKMTVEIYPKDATNQNVSWTTSNKQVAVIYSDGTVIANGLGSCELTVKTESGNCSDKCTVTVTPKGEALPEYIDEYGINNGEGIKIGKHIWAPVNCGYKAATEKDKGYPYGKLYQWGRKDGLGYDKNFDEMVAEKDDKTILSSVKDARPGIFYSKWDEKVAPDGTWGGKDGKTKTENDPCPEGWRVPTIEELDSMKGEAADLEAGSTWRRGDIDDTPRNLFGRWFGQENKAATNSDPKGCLFIPAAGRLVNTHGVPRNRTYEGVYWASQNSSIYATHADNLYFFENSYIYIQDSQRGSAFSIRCIKD